MPASIFAYYADSLQSCVAFIAIATGAHQAWSANLFTSATDLFPQKVSGSVVGLGATAGGIGGMFMTLLVGLIVQWTGNQQLVFVWAGMMHLISLALFWLWFRGRFTQVDVDAGLDTSRTNLALAIGGALVAAGGALLSVFVMNRWEYHRRHREIQRRAGGGDGGRRFRDHRPGAALRRIAQTQPDRCAELAG